MKSLVLTLSLLLSFSVFAHTTRDLKKATNASVEATRAATLALAIELNKNYDNVGGGVVFNAYKITTVSPERPQGESDLKFAARLLKAVLHRDYPITGDDGGYGFSQIKTKTEAETADYISSNMGWLENQYGDSRPAELKPVVAALSKITNLPGIIVLSGDGAGNNTMASIFAVVDLNTNELFYTVDSNFGSDD